MGCATTGRRSVSPSHTVSVTRTYRTRVPCETRTGPCASARERRGCRSVTSADSHLSTQVWTQPHRCAGRRGSVSGRICGAGGGAGRGRTSGVCAPPQRDARAECYRDLCHVEKGMDAATMFFTFRGTNYTGDTHTHTATRVTLTALVPTAVCLYRPGPLHCRTSRGRCCGSEGEGGGRRLAALACVALECAALACASWPARGGGGKGRRRQALADRVWPCELSVVEQSVPAAVTKPVRAA